MSPENYFEGKRVAIIGSCVTRDIIQLIKPSELSCFARTSFISLVEAPVAIESDLVDIEGAFEKRMVLSDFDKRAILELKEFKPDALIIDFIDERFGIVQIKDSKVTNSSLLVKSGALEGFEHYGIIARNHAHEMWYAACDKMVEVFKSLNCKVVLHKAWWATKYLDHDVEKICNFDGLDLRLANQNNDYLSRYYNYIESKLDGLVVIEAPEELVFSDFAHKWGRDFFHYSEKYYRYMSGVLSMQGNGLAKNYHYGAIEVDFNRLVTGFSIALHSKTLNLDEHQFVFVLFKDKAKAYEVRWVKDQRLNFDDYGDGVYYVQVEYRKIGTKASKFIRTKTISSFSQAYKAELDMKVSAQDAYCPDINFMPSKDPFNDFLLVNDSGWAQEGFKRFDTPLKGYHLYLNGQETELDEFFMSGFCITEDAVYLSGQNDISEFSAEEVGSKVKGSVGTFSLIQFYSDSIQLSVDYHSTSKLWYFSENGVALVTNRYHLALTFLKERGGEFVFNKRKAIAMLSTGYHQLFSHNFNSECLARGLYQLYVGEQINVMPDGIDISTLDVHDVIDDSSLFDIGKESYDELLAKSASEIKNNVSSVLKSKKFSDVVVDVSGGIDSRTVFCAVSNFDESKEKVSVRINQSQFEYDHLVANTINDLYQYRFHTARNGWERTFYEPHQYMSFILETKYFMPSEAEIHAPDTVLLNGFYGEPSLRPRGADSFLFGASYESDDLTDECFIENMVSFQSSPVMIVDYDKAGHMLKEVYAEEYKRTPGKSIGIKLENHYLNFSHAYHASESLRPGRDVASFSPIKSKTLFKLYRSVFAKFKSRKLAFDLIYTLNPLVSIVKYESESYNKEYEETKENLKVSESAALKNASIKPLKDVLLWQESQEDLRINVKSNNRMPPKKEYETCLALIGWLEKKDPDFIKYIKYELLHFAGRVKDNYLEINTLKNKLISICVHV